MNKLFSRIAISGILAAAAMFAAQINDLRVTLPHPVTVGSTTLPVGSYTITPVEMSNGDEFFVVRGEKTSPVTLPAQRIDGAASAKTQLTFSEDGNTWRFDRLSIAGDSTAYEFSK
jgi:hypothetical protein